MVVPVKLDKLSPRCYIIGLPKNTWHPETIARALQEIQIDFGPPMHVHGLYVIGVGYFETIPVESPEDQQYGIRGWTGKDRLYHFAMGFWGAFDRWPRRSPSLTVDLSSYGAGEARVFLEGQPVSQL